MQQMNRNTILLKIIYLQNLIDQKEGTNNGEVAV